MSSILLKRIWNGDLTGVSVILFSWFICVLALALTKGCSNIEEKPRYSKLATPIYWEEDTIHIKDAASGSFLPENNWDFRTDKHTTYIYDTTKPKPINHRLTLSGSDTTFRFLVFAIQNPMDITPNQKTQLLNWINTVKLDTTVKK